MATERKCLVCGKKYEYCPHCNKSNLNIWKSTYCSEACRDIFNLCCDFEGKRISQEDSYNKLIELNINDINAQKSVKGSVEKIMAVAKVEPVVVVEEEPSPVEEEVVSEDNITIDEQSVQKRSRRHRSYKKYDE